MAGEYIVQAGDYLASIARTHGIRDWRVLWDHPENAVLKASRKTPDILAPGDRVYIPEPTARQVDAPTDARHRFTLKAQLPTLNVLLHRQYDDPLAGIDCLHAVDGQVRPMVSDAQGGLVRPIPSDAHVGQVTLRNVPALAENLQLDLAIGHLDPVETLRGQQQRLDNLGYMAGPYGRSPEDNARLFDSAVQEFQCDQGLVVDGVCGSRTQAALRQMHGC